MDDETKYEEKTSSINIPPPPRRTRGPTSLPKESNIYHLGVLLLCQGDLYKKCICVDNESFSR